MKTELNYFYLNIGNQWPKFALTNLEIASDGALQLRALPRLAARLPEKVTTLPIPQKPAGIARTADGTLFFTEPEAHRLWKIDPCDLERTPGPAACIGGGGSDAGQFRFPRGLLFLPGRGLLIADSGNDRIQMIDPLTSRVREIWNGIDSHGKPLLNEPWALAADRDSNIYVVVHGDQSLQKLDRWGRIDPSFRANVEASGALSPPNGTLSEPTAVAIAEIDGEERVLVLDRGQLTIVVFSIEGYWQKTFAAQDLQEPLALAVSKQAVYIGDNGARNRNVLQFDLPSLQEDQLNFAGRAVGYRGPIAALFIDLAAAEQEKSCNQQDDAHATNAEYQPNLLLLAGDGLTPFVLKEGSGYLPGGFAVAGPFDFRRQPVAWHRLQALAEALPPHTHLRFFFRFSESPSPLTLGSPPQEPFSNWCAFPADATDGLFGSFTSNACRQQPVSQNGNGDGRNTIATSTYLWLGLKFSGDGVATPRIHQIRLQFDHESYLPYLPALYSEDKSSRQFLVPLLSLFESFFAEQEAAIAGLPALFDPAAVPAEFLEWLAGWLAQDLQEEWSAARKRRMIAATFAAYARRGTPGGLRQRIQDFAGVQTHILEPLVNADLWSLDETSTMGFDTMLAPAEAQGAVLGTTATLDRSHLITDAEFGAPLFEDLAHRFTVAVYPDAVSTPQKMAGMQAIIERDKPAHTAYHLCVIRPGVQVGFQSQVGIDTVVGGPAPATPLAEQTGSGLVLTGTPLAGLGEGTEVGVNTELY